MKNNLKTQTLINLKTQTHQNGTSSSGGGGGGTAPEGDFGLVPPLPERFIFEP
jgi:hypothetical protein